jgi:hypothetical protein
MNSSISRSGIPTSHPEQVLRGGRWRVVLVGLSPLILLAAIVIATLLLIAFLRPLVIPDGFFVEERITVGIAVVGLALAIIVYTTGIVRALRHIKVWHHNGDSVAVIGGLGVLSVTAIVVALPVLLALFMH